jgi:hypothetical protein
LKPSDDISYHSKRLRQRHPASASPAEPAKARSWYFFRKMIGISLHGVA